MSLAKMVFGGSDQIDVRVQGKKYSWKQVYSAPTIREIHNDRTYTSVLVDVTDCYLGYANSVMDEGECWLYPEGDLLICLTMGTFAGTLASHDNIEVQYFHLTPNRNWDSVSFHRWDGYNVIEH